MRRILLYFIVIFFLTGCAKNNEADIFQYKNSYVGDNVAVVNSVVQLPGEQYFSGLQLKTKEEPYGIIINYDWTEADLNDKETAIHNASYLFALIQNVDWVTFRFEKINNVAEYKITREQLQVFYDTDLRKIDNEEALKELIEKAHPDEVME